MSDIREVARVAISRTVRTFLSVGTVPHSEDLVLFPQGLEIINKGPALSQDLFINA